MTGELKTTLPPVQSEGRGDFFFLTPTASLPLDHTRFLIGSFEHVGHPIPPGLADDTSSAAGLRDSGPSRRPLARMHVANMGLDLFSFQYYAHAHGRNSLTQHAWL